MLCLEKEAVDLKTAEQEACGPEMAEEEIVHKVAGGA